VALIVFATAMRPGLTGSLIDVGVPYPWQIAGMGAYCLGGVIATHLVRERVLIRNASVFIAATR
jgi:hypothetical protein